MERENQGIPKYKDISLDTHSNDDDDDDDDNHINQIAYVAKRISDISLNFPSETRFNITPLNKKKSPKMDFINYERLEFNIAKQRKQSSRNKYYSSYPSVPFVDMHKLIIHILCKKLGPKSSAFRTFVTRGGLSGGLCGENLIGLEIRSIIPIYGVEWRPKGSIQNSNSTNGKEYNEIAVYKTSYFESNELNNSSLTTFLKNKFSNSHIELNPKIVLNLDGSINKNLSYDLFPLLRSCCFGMLKYINFCDYPTFNITASLPYCSFINLHLIKRFEITHQMFIPSESIISEKNKFNHISAKDILKSLKSYLPDFFQKYKVDIEINELSVTQFSNEFNFWCVTKKSKSCDSVALILHLPRALNNYYQDNATEIFDLFDYLIKDSKNISVCNPNPIICSIIISILFRYKEVKRDHISFQDSFNQFIPLHSGFIPSYSNYDGASDTKLWFYGDYLIRFNLSRMNSKFDRKNPMTIFNKIVPFENLNKDFDSLNLFEKTVVSQDFYHLMKESVHLINQIQKNQLTESKYDHLLMSYMAARKRLVECYNAHFTSCYESLSQIECKKISLTLLFSPSSCLELEVILSQFLYKHTLELSTPDHLMKLQPEDLEHRITNKLQPEDLEHRITNRFFLFLITNFESLHFGNLSLDSDVIEYDELIKIKCKEIIFEDMNILYKMDPKMISYLENMTIIINSKVYIGSNKALLNMDPSLLYKIYTQDSKRETLSFPKFLEDKIDLIASLNKNSPQELYQLPGIKKLALWPEFDFNKKEPCREQKEFAKFLNKFISNTNSLKSNSESILNESLSSDNQDSIEIKSFDPYSRTIRQINLPKVEENIPKIQFMASANNHIRDMQYPIFIFCNFIPYQIDHKYCLGWKPEFRIDKSLTNYGEILFTTTNVTYPIEKFDQYDIFNTQIFKERTKLLFQDESFDALINKVKVLLKQFCLMKILSICDENEFESKLHGDNLDESFSDKEIYKAMSFDYMPSKLPKTNKLKFILSFLQFVKPMSPMSKMTYNSLTVRGLLYAISEFHKSELDNLLQNDIATKFSSYMKKDEFIDWCVAFIGIYMMNVFSACSNLGITLLFHVGETNFINVRKEYARVFNSSEWDKSRAINFLKNTMKMVTSNKVHRNAFGYLYFGEESDDFL